MTHCDPRIEKIRHRLGYGWNPDELLLLMEAEIERLTAAIEEGARWRRSREVNMAHVPEHRFAELVTWAMCRMADGGGPGNCDPSHCVCGAEGDFVAKSLYEAGFRLLEIEESQS